MAAPNIVFNGRFLTAPATGVQRVAERLIVAYAGMAQQRGEARLSLVSPLSARPFSCSGLTVRKAGRLPGQAWEQFDLPRFVGAESLLINLCNLAPLAVAHSITMIHDAQVFETPESYSAAFRAWYHFAQPRIGRWNRKILTVSNYSKDQLIKFGVAKPDKIAVVHNGLDHILESASDPGILGRLPKGDKFALAFASTQAHKNLRVLLDAYRNGNPAGVHLVLFGATTPEALAAAGLPLPPGTIWLGRVSDGELRALMERALCFLFPSTTEGFGLPAGEAMLVGCPVIASPCGAIPEVCGEAAIYCDPREAQAWADAIRMLSDEGVESRALRTAASIERASMFTWSAAANKLSAIVDEVTARATATTSHGSENFR